MLICRQMLCLVALLALAGCSGNAPSPGGGTGNLAHPDILTGSPTPNPPPEQSKALRPAPPGIVARIAGQDITWDMLQKPLVDAYGLQITLHLVQLEMAKQKAREKGATVTPEDIAEERRRFGGDGRFLFSLLARRSRRHHGRDAIG